jgi:iron-sulfur cluster repair protein YtfE (RIC family)
MMERTHAELGTRGYDTVTAYLTADHRRLDELFDRACEHCGMGALILARDLWGELDQGLRRHIALEESTVFPTFLERTGITGPIAVMRHEHRQIEALLQTAACALAEDDTAGFSQAAGALRQLLGAHNHKEERVLYPKTDASLSLAEQRHLAERLARS